MPVTDFQPFHQIKLDFAFLPEVAWLERWPSPDAPNRCKVACFPRTYFIDAIKHSNQTMSVVKRVPLSALVSGGFEFLFKPVVYEDIELFDLDSKVSLAALAVAAPGIHISLIDIIPDHSDEDYERAMKTIG